MGTRHNGCHAAGLKQEVATALRTLRDKLLAEQKEKEVKELQSDRDGQRCYQDEKAALISTESCCVLQRLASSSCVAKRKHLEHRELLECSVQQLISLRMSLQQEVHGTAPN